MILAHQRVLKAPLKRHRGAVGTGENNLQVFDGLQEGIGLGTLGGLPLTAEPGPYFWQAPAQALKQVVKCFQSERRRELFDSRLDGIARQAAAEQPPKPSSRDGMARQHFGQENGKGAATTAALPAIGAPDSLPALGLMINGAGIVTEKLAVAV